MSAPKRVQPPKCSDCDRRLPSSKPRVQDSGRWYCPDCFYHRSTERERVHAVVPLQRSA